MVTERQHKKADKAANARDPLISGSEQKDYIKMNRQSRKLASVPTPTTHLPGEAVKEREDYPFPVTENGTRHPRKGA